MSVLHNVKGSSLFEKPSTGEESWLKYWENRHAQMLDTKVYKCPCCGQFFPRSRFDGCHVQKNSLTDMSWYILPLCDSCNHVEEPIIIDDDGLLEPVPSNQ